MAHIAIGLALAGCPRASQAPDTTAPTGISNMPQGHTYDARHRLTSEIERGPGGRVQRELTITY
jgi:hypothetical protein